MTNKAEQAKASADWAMRKAEELPCLQTHPVWCVPGGEHGVKCPAHYRPWVAAALREVAEREYARGLEGAAKAMCGLCANAYGRGDDDQPVIPHYDDKYSAWMHGENWRCDAGPIRALATGEQSK